ELRNDFRVGEHHHVGYTLELRHLSNMLERRAALPQNYRPRARQIGIENRLHWLAEAGSEVKNKRIRNEVKHVSKKASAGVSRYSRNFAKRPPSCPSA